MDILHKETILNLKYYNWQKVLKLNHEKIKK